MTPFLRWRQNPISKLLSEKAGDIAGRVTEGNSSLIRAVAETRKNLEEYNKVLENFQKTVDKSDEVIQNAVKTLDQVNASAKSGVQTLSDSGTVHFRHKNSSRNIFDTVLG